MADEGGVTLRIDADTARYIAGIAKAADANKDLVNGTKALKGSFGEINELGVAIAGRLAGWAGPIGAAGAGIALIDKATEAWYAKLTKAGDAMKEIADLTTAIAGSGRGQQAGAIKDAISAGSPALTGQQQVAFYNAFNATNPNASPAQIQEAAAAANAAGTLGRDVGQFSGLYGSLNRSGAANPADLANYLMTYAGGGADKAAALIAKNPGQAAQIAELFATAERGGRGAVSLLDRASADFSSRGGRGDFATSLNARVAGAAGADDLKYLLDPRNRAPAFRAGSLAAAEREAMNDPDVSARILSRQANEAAEDASYETMGAEARRRALATSVVNLQDARGSTASNMVRDLRAIIPFYAADRFDPFLKEKSTGYLMHAASETELRQILSELQKQNQIPKAPRVSRHGESAP